MAAFGGMAGEGIRLLLVEGVLRIYQVGITAVLTRFERGLSNRGLEFRAGVFLTILGCLLMDPTIL